MHQVKIKKFHIGQGQPLAIMSGPCVIESEEEERRVGKSVDQV